MLNSALAQDLSLRDAREKHTAFRHPHVQPDWLLFKTAGNRGSTVADKNFDADEQKRDRPGKQQFFKKGRPRAGLANIAVSSAQSSPSR